MGEGGGVLSKGGGGGGGVRGGGGGGGEVLYLTPPPPQNSRYDIDFFVSPQNLARGKMSNFIEIFIQLMSCTILLERGR